VGAVKAEAEGRVSAGQTVHRGGTEGNKERLAVLRGCRRGLREELEAPSDQHGAAAAVLQLKGLGGLQTTYKAPL